MKKLLSLLLALVMIFSLAACSGDSKTSDEDEEDTEEVTEKVTPSEKAVTNYIQYMQDENVEKLYAMLPKAVREYLAEEDIEEDFLDALEYACEDFYDNYEDCTFAVLDASKMAEEELEEYAEEIEDISDEIDAELTIQDGSYVIIKITDEDGYVTTRIFDVLKVNGTWFVINLLYP